MKFPHRRFGAFATALLLFFAACTPEIPEQTSTPQPTPAVLRVNLAVELNPLRPDLSGCAARTGNTGILVFEALEPALPTDAGSVTLALGQPSGWAGGAALLGSERIVAAAADIGEQAALQDDQLAALYTGISTALPGRPGPAEIWIPLEGTASRAALDHLIGAESYHVEGFLAPDPETTAAALAQNPEAVGVLPAAWLTPDLITLVEIDDLPVLALTLDEPAGTLRHFLGCLQDANIYSP